MTSPGTEAEARRLRVLDAYAILDTPPEIEFDDVARLASDICATPIAVISLVDDTRQWFKARIGIDIRETARDISFCTYALDSAEIFEVADAQADPRFAGNPLVKGDPFIRFYAGAPLVTPVGAVIGTIAVIDRQPRRLTADQRRALLALSRQVMQLLELRRQLRARESLDRNLQARLSQQIAVAQLGVDAAAATAIKPFLQHSVDIVAHTLGIELSSLIQLDESGERATVLITSGWDSDWLGYSVGCDPGGEYAFVLESNTPVFVSDYRSEKRFRVSPNLFPLGIASGIGVRLKLRERMWGILTAHSRSARAFTADDAVFVQTVANLLAATIERLETQERLERSEYIMRLAQQIAQVGYWQIDLQTNHARWSDELYRIWGIDPAFALRRREIVKRIHPDDLDVMAQYVERLNAGEFADIEYRIVRDDGIRYLRERGGSLRPFPDAEPRLMGTVMDITDVKHAEMALQESAALLEIASEVAGMGGWRYDVAAGQLTWSSQIRKIYEIGEDAEPSLAMEHFPIEERTRLRAAFDACIGHGTPFDTEVRFVSERGRKGWVRVIGRPWRDEHGVIRAAQGAVQDISERKTAEEKFNRLSHQLITMLESMTDAFVMLDAQWRFTYVNRQAELYLEQTRESVLGNYLWDIVPDVRETGILAKYEHARATGESVAFAHYFEAQEQWYDVRAYPTPDGLTLYFRRVTDRVRQERQLREQALLLDQANDAILVLDLEHAVQFWNQAAERLYGWSRDEVMGRTIETLVSEAELNEFETDLSAFGAATQHVLLHGEWNGRLQQRRRNGTSFTAECHWTLLRGDEGAPRAVLCINTDISDQLDLEERLAQSQKLEAIGQLTGGIAHDFNNLLTVIIGNVELVAESLPDDHPLAPLVRLIGTAADRGAELTSRLLSFARRQTLQPRVVSPVNIIRDLTPLLHRTLGESIEIEEFHDPDVWDVSVDPTQFESALLNLSLNARDAMPDGGKLTLETANVTLDETYTSRHVDVAPGPYVLVAVSDTGKGMTADVQARVFDPFFTTKEKGKGTGLGLSMVYGFVKQSGGHIKLYSEPGHGAAFNLYLPRAHGGDVDSVDHAHPVHATDGNEHILLVEDDELVREHASSILYDLGYRLTVAPNGIEALQLLRDGLRVDLLFTDVIMPGGLNGPQLAVEARRLLPGLPVLFTSGYTENAIVKQGQAPGGFLLLHKPYRRHTLATKVRQALADGMIFKGEP